MHTYFQETAKNVVSPKQGQTINRHSQVTSANSVTALLTYLK